MAVLERATAAQTPNAKGPARTAILPSHGSNNPLQGKAANMSSITTAAPGAASRDDMEDCVQNAYRFALILADMLEDTLEYGRAEKVGDQAFRFLLGKEELENIAFMAVQSQYAARLVREGYYEDHQRRTAA